MTGFFYSGLLASSVGNECASRNTHRAGWQLCSFAALQLCSHHETRASFTSAWEDLLRRAVRASLLPWFKPYFQMLPHHSSHIDGRRRSASISTAGLISSTLTPDASLSPKLTYHTELQLTDAGVSKRARPQNLPGGMLRYSCFLATLASNTRTLIFIPTWLSWRKGSLQ